jgi:hypothetical protein
MKYISAIIIIALLGLIWFVLDIHIGALTQNPARGYQVVTCWDKGIEFRTIQWRWVISKGTYANGRCMNF